MIHLRCVMFGHKYTKVSHQELTWRFMVVIALCEQCGKTVFKEWVPWDQR